jgi:hypothetical protein
MANEFYYNKGLAITKEEAHALTDKSQLIVSDLERTKTFLTNMLSKSNEEESSN